MNKKLPKNDRDLNRFKLENEAAENSSLDLNLEGASSIAASSNSSPITNSTLKHAVDESTSGKEKPLLKGLAQAKKKSINPNNSKVLGITRPMSACKRCRRKKIKCDQRFPNCSRCEKAGVECIGLDPVLGRDIPRSYVLDLENRVGKLEQLLDANGIKINEDELYPNLSSSGASMYEKTGKHIPISDKNVSEQTQNGRPHTTTDPECCSVPIKSSEETKYEKNISFDKLIFTAVKFNQKNQMSLHNGGNGSVKGTPHFVGMPQDPTISNNETTTFPSILPPKSTAIEFIRIYFSQLNAQLPILHREEFVEKWFEPIYGAIDNDVSLADNAANKPKATKLASLGSTVSGMASSQYDDEERSVSSSCNASSSHLSPDNGGEKTSSRTIQYEETWLYHYKKHFENLTDKDDLLKILNDIIPPPKFCKPLYFLNMVFAIASSVHHLQYPTTISHSFKSAAMKYIDSIYSSLDPLESLQGILLLALYSTMRPAVPGIWYVLGTALRLCVDMGLHNDSIFHITKDPFTRDMRRRLFWCTYSLDRQICFYLNRPVGIPDECINTSFPSLLDDKYLVRGMEQMPSNPSNEDDERIPSYKHISLTFFQMRQIQSETQRVLYENLEIPRKYASLEEWKVDMSHLLINWYSQIPLEEIMNCNFNSVFFRLNFHHTMMMLHNLSPKNYILSDADYDVVCSSAQGLIKCYYQLFETKLINYTWAAVHNLFMAGSTFLYAIYNSEKVRNKNSSIEVKKITLDCLTVLHSLVDRCDAAFNCCEVFKRLTMVIIKLKYNEVVYGNTNPLVENTRPKIKMNSNLTKLVEKLLESTITEELQRERKRRRPTQNSSNNNNKKKLKHLHQQQQGLPLNQPPMVSSNSASFINTKNGNATPIGFYQVPPNGLQSSGTSGTSELALSKALPNDILSFNDLFYSESPMDFEWRSDNVEQSDAQGDTNLESFFAELENLSPTNSEELLEVDSLNEDPITGDSMKLEEDTNICNPQSSYHPSQQLPQQQQAQMLQLQLQLQQSHVHFNLVQVPSSMSPPPPVYVNPRLRLHSNLLLLFVPSNNPLRSVSPPLPLDDSPYTIQQGRKVFELLQQMPTESIWDQYFASGGNFNGPPGTMPPN